MKRYLLRLYSWFQLIVLSPIKWTYVRGLYRNGKYWDLTKADWDELRRRLRPHYYFIVTYRKTHLTTYLQQIAGLVLRGTFTRWTHAFLNMDDGTAKEDVQYVFLESTAEGVHYSTFTQVFDCDAVGLITPKGMTPQEWTDVIDAAVAQKGKPYDTLFDYRQNRKLSCVELVRTALQEGLPDYKTRFANFEALIEREGYLLPQMLAECPDFDIQWQVRR